MKYKMNKVKFMKSIEFEIHLISLLSIKKLNYTVMLHLKTIESLL